MGRYEHTVGRKAFSNLDIVRILYRAGEAMVDLSLINRDHVIQAVALIERRGIEKKDQSREWDVLIHGKRYPPKYVMRVAYSFSVGYELGSRDTRTGVAQDRLRELGFKIVPKLEPFHNSVPTT